MKTNSKIKTYHSYEEIQKANGTHKNSSNQAPYQFLNAFYQLKNEL